MGQNNSLTSRLKIAAPGITIFKCSCHSIHLCASNAAKTPPRCEDLIRSIYTYFSHSAKRKSEFWEFQDFCQTKPHKILHVAQTRWLSLHMAVSRVLGQWRPLILYFTNKHIEYRLAASDLIYGALKDPSLEIYFKFLDFILSYFSNFNKLLQKSKPTIHLLHNKCRRLYSDILRCYCIPSKLTGAQLSEIDPRDERNFVPVNHIYLGPEVHRTLQDPGIASNIYTHDSKY